jgi:hypothetical protein
MKHTAEKIAAESNAKKIVVSAAQGYVFAGLWLYSGETFSNCRKGEMP